VSRSRTAACLCLAFALLSSPGSATPRDANLTGILVVARGERFAPDGAEASLDFALVDDAGHVTTLVPGDGVDATAFAELAGRRVVVTTERRARAREVTFFHEVTVEAKTRTSDRGKAFDPRATGTHPLLTILCRFADSQDVTPFREETAAHFFAGSGQRSLGEYWREVSYGAVDLSGSRVVGWVNLPHPRSQYAGDFDADGDEELLFQQVFEDAVATAGQSVAVGSYFAVNLVFNQHPIANYAWQAYVRPIAAAGVETIPATFVGPYPPSRPGVYAHETGHALGFPHSSGPYASEYDSDWDCMSLGSSVHTIGFHKDLAGWIPESRRVVFRDEPTKTVTFAPLSEPNAPGALLGVIPLDDEGTRFYTIEARRRTNYDYFVPADGIVLHQVDLTRGDRTARVVDATLNGNPDDDGAVWTVGERFTEPESGIVISVDAVSGSGYVVTVVRHRTAPGACATTVPAGHWRGEYFATIRTFGAVAVRDDGTGQLSPALGAAGPFPACGAGDNFSARWTRDVTLAEGVYGLTVVLAGGARVRVDGRTVFDRLRNPTYLTTFDVEVALTSGTHRIEVTYRDTVQSPALSVRLDGPHPGFRLEVDQAPRSVAPGGSARCVVRVVGLGGFQAPVTLSASTEPGLGGGSVRLDDDSLRAGESTGATIAVDQSAPAGTLALRLEARSGALSTSRIVLVRTRLGFTISCVPGTLDVGYGSKGEFAVVVARDPGMTAPIDVRLTGGTPGYLKLKPAEATTASDQTTFRYKVKKSKRPVERLHEFQCVATDGSGATQFAALRLTIR
jgi:M6 family metalloprotease-like protein